MGIAINLNFIILLTKKPSEDGFNYFLFSNGKIGIL